MKTIEVKASRSYCVHIGSKLLSQVGNYARNATGGRIAAIISDDHVWPIYGNTVLNSLKDAGYEVCNFVFPAGEMQKNPEVFLSILNFLAENGLTRSDVVLALGGGVVGDITGFAASVYLRGIAYIQIPTSLLAMVDSSVGGKTAIDLPAGKNLVGAFYQPALVLCDVDTLQTLPDETFLDGCAEVIKYAILYDPSLFTLLSQTKQAFPKEDVVAKCVQWKRDVVAQDEFDKGARQLLNLGHTIGHSVEANSEFGISHGVGVAIGTAIVTRAACNLGICSEATRDQILKILSDFGFPITTCYSPSSLFKYAQSDKKRFGNTINLIVPKTIGDCMIQNTPIDELESFIKAGL